MVDMFTAAADAGSMLAVDDELGVVLLAPPVEDTSPDETAPDLSDCNRPNDGDTVLVVKCLLILQRDEVGRGEDAPRPEQDSAAGDGRAVHCECWAMSILGKYVEVGAQSKRSLVGP